MSACILTAYYNPTNSPHYLANFNKFLNNLAKHNLLEHLYVCEISSTNNSEFYNIKNYYYVFCNSNIWHKESAINYLLRRLPVSYDKVIVTDNDLIFDDHDWFSKTTELLDKYNLVQPYEYVQYIGPKTHLIDTIEIPTVKKILHGDMYYTGNPGLCTAYRRDYLEFMGGLFDLALVGGGDSINIMPFISNEYIEYNIFDRVCFDKRIDLLNYIQQAKLYLKYSKLKSATFLADSLITHMYHGWRVNRQYNERYNIIKNIYFDDFFYRNDIGFIELYKNNYAQIQKQQEINGFFNIRNKEELFPAKPLIVNTNKYTVDNDILWLSNYNILSFSNISYAEIQLNQTQQLKYLQIICDNQIINHKFIDNQYLLKIVNPQTLIINSDSFIPSQLNTGTDSRKLSIYISSIKIISNDSNFLSEYALKDVI